MHCRSCNAENPDATKFCGNCGQPLKSRCDKCGTENPAQFRFCGECGAGLIDSAGSAVDTYAAEQARVNDATLEDEAGDARDGERRHLTVLFCDLVGSTSLAAQLDPEEWRAIIADYHRAVGQAAERFGGYVAQYLGDGVMAYFGWPEAHDNDAERAARAGLAILEAISKLNQQPERPRLSTRVGIDSGAVVVGASAGKDADVFGDVPNIASRVQNTADPDTVMITEATHRLVSGMFIVEDRGAHLLKGVEQPFHLYRVTQPSGVRGRLEAVAATHGLTRFVGREDELRLLLNRWERACEGEGQVALIIGEGGIGKSRLLQHFHEQIKGTAHTWVEATAAPLFQNTPFYPIAEALKQALAWRGDESPEERLGLLESRLERAGLKPGEAVPLLVRLLDKPVTAKYPPSTLSPEQQRRRLLATLVGWVLGATRVQPLVFAIEDLQWADPSTLELIQLLVEQGEGSRLLLLYTARPEFRAQWPLRAHHTQVNLNRLSTRNVRTMVTQVAAHEPLSEETIATVVERTGGVPLFVEELTRAVLERGIMKFTRHEIPVTLHDSLVARLDRLGPAKEVIQVGAVIGGEFSYELLHAVYPIAEEHLQGALRDLAAAQLVYVRGIAPDATYRFKHALIRDAAYEALLRSRRRDLHRLLARTIDERFPALKEEQPEVLARHWTEAGETEPAIAEWSRAGKAAEIRNAFREALESYQQAVALFKLLPESPERDLRELELRQLVVETLYLTRGYSAPETIDATESAAALAEKSGNLKQLVNWLLRRGLIAITTGDFPGAGAALDRALELALREGSPTNLASVYTLQLPTRYWRGDLAGAEQHFTEGLKFFDDLDYRQLLGGAVTAFGYASWVAWTLGRADVARQREMQMMAAASPNNSYAATVSVHLAAHLRAYRREYEQAEALAASALGLSEKHQFPYITALSRCALGRARAQLGRTTEGIELIRQGIADLYEMGSPAAISKFMTFLAEAQAHEGAIAEALETVEQALRVNLNEVVYRPETIRLRAELRLKQGHTELAEGDFREAIGLAQKMRARAWELRTTMSLARLLEKLGRRHEARTMLAEIYNWFTEGFDTADLKDAKALLDQLSG